MSSNRLRLLESGDLSVYLERGEVRNSRGDCARLARVNARVLVTLMSRAGEVVSRRELYDEVWKNQVVGDDALTRCISDIRAELAKLSNDEELIETLPKRGYRWTHPVRARDIDVAEPIEPPTRAATEHRGRATRWIARGVGYTALALLLTTVGIWIADQVTRPAALVVAVLPITTDAGHASLGPTVEQLLTDYVIRLDQVDLLSRTAVASRPSNPFPFFYYEFGASWLIESEIRSVAGNDTLTVTLVDARTGIVLIQSETTVDAQSLPPAVVHMMQPIAAFFEQQRSRRR